jgi:hypothetical protein
MQLALIGKERIGEDDSSSSKTTAHAPRGWRAKAHVASRGQPLQVPAGGGGAQAGQRQREGVAHSQVGGFGLPWWGFRVRRLLSLLSLSCPARCGPGDLATV